MKTRIPGAKKMPDDIAPQLRTRLLALMNQLQRDQSAMQSQPAFTDTYNKLFDSLQSTLHNLESSQAAEKNLPPLADNRPE